MNRLIFTDFYNDGKQELRTYDSFGNLQQVANGGIIYSFTYDQQNRLISKNDERLDHNGATTNKTLSWTYDKVGNVATKTDYQGKTTNYQYNSANRLIAQSNSDHVQVSYFYDEAGRLVNRILSNDPSASSGQAQEVRRR